MSIEVIKIDAIDSASHGDFTTGLAETIPFALSYPAREERPLVAGPSAFPTGDARVKLLKSVYGYSAQS